MDTHINHLIAQELERRDAKATIERQAHQIAALEKTVTQQGAQLAELAQAFEALIQGVISGVCPATAKRPQIVNSIASLRNIDGEAKVGQVFDVLVGGSNGRETHEVVSVDARGRILQTRVLSGPTVFVVPDVHRIRDVSID
jgi:hypothetical protein